MGPSFPATRSSQAMGVVLTATLAPFDYNPYITCTLYGIQQSLYGRRIQVDDNFNTPSSLRAGLRCRCPRCGEGHVFSRFLTVADQCDACGQTGYAGRTGVFEVMPISSELRRMISDGASPRILRAQAVAEKMLTFRQSALLKA